MQNVPWTSPTLWAAIVTVAASVAALIGITITPAEQAEIAAALGLLASAVSGLVVLVRRFLPRS